MKVLHVYRTYFPATQGGLEETIRQICHNTAQHGVESRVLAPAFNADKKVVMFEGSRVYQPKGTFELASCTVSVEAFGMYRKLTEWCDVVHYHFPWPFADVLHLTQNPHRPSVLTYHSDVVRQRFLYAFYRPLMHRFLSKIDRIVCTSPNYFATSEVLSRFEDKVSVIPFGLNEETYPVPDQQTMESVREQFGEGFFLFVGVLRYYKGLHILLDAIQNTPFKVVIVGSGPTETELREQAAQLGLTNVHFAGYVSDIVKVALFKLSHAVVFPSYLRSEAFGVTLLEGAMYGKPLISTEVGSGTSHVNIDGETGLVVVPGSANALKAAMQQLYHRADQAQSMGQRARQRFEQLFSGALMGQRYADTYRGVLRDTERDSSQQTHPVMPQDNVLPQDK